MAEDQAPPWNAADGEYKRLHISLLDLDLVRHHARHLLKEELFRGREKGKEDLYNQQAAFVSALVVAYGRIFTTSKGLPKFPMELTQYNEEETKLHDKLMEVRHTLYAHSDSKSFHVLTSRNTIIRTILPYRLKREEIELLLAMSERLAKSIVNRINELDRSDRE